MNDNNQAQATLAGGCFWCTEAVFQNLRGVSHVESGYSGGHVVNPSYEEVCRKTTGHAEVIRVTYDPAVISFSDLLDVFWATHDPTTPNQQGNDKGPQYRSAIFYTSEEEREIAEKSMQAADASDLWPNPIVTEISPLINYYPAEPGHQNYFQRIGNQNPYCTYVINPKVEKLKVKFGDKLK